MCVGKGPITATSCRSHQSRSYPISGLTFGACERLPLPTPKGLAITASYRSGTSVSSDCDPAEEERLGSCPRKAASAADALRSFTQMAGLLPAPLPEFLGPLRSLREGVVGREIPQGLGSDLTAPPHFPPAAGDWGGSKPWLMMMI